MVPTTSTGQRLIMLLVGFNKMNSGKFEAVRWYGKECLRLAPTYLSKR